MFVNFGGTQLSCSDSSRSSLMVFLRGCPYNCFFCHNKDLNSGENLVDVEVIKRKIEESRPFVSEVIFSGGEAMLQPEAIKALAIFAKRLGLETAIETSGYNSNGVYELLKADLIDEVFLDLKTFGEEEYFKLTEKRDSWDSMLKTLLICLDFGIPLEIRTTIFKNHPGEDILMKMNNFIKDRGLNWKKQEGVAQ